MLCKIDGLVSLLAAETAAVTVQASVAAGLGVSRCSGG